MPALKYWNGSSWDTILAGPATPSGPAGGDLSGTYPNPSIAAGSIVDADVAAAANLNGSKLLSGSIEGTKIGWNVSTTPPGSPSNGTLWVYNHATGGWVFTYEPTGNPTYPWLCIGGTPLFSQDPPERNIAMTAGAWAAGSPICQVLFPRAGNYVVEAGGSMRPGTGADTSSIGVQIASANPAIYDGTWTAGGYNPVTSGRTNHYVKLHGTGLASGANALWIGANTVTQTMTVNNRFVAIMPSRVQ